MSQYFLAVPILAYIPCMIPFFLRKVEQPQRGLMILTAFVLHLIILILVTLSSDGWQSSPGLSLSLLSAILTFALLSLRHLKPRFSELDKIVLPIVTLLLFFGAFSPNADAGLSLENWVMVHLWCILLGFLAFTLAFAFAALYLIQRQRLKQKKFTEINKYPSLSILDTYNYYAIISGFILLTLGMSMGMFSVISDQKVINFDWTIATTLLLWIWYAISIHSRLYVGRQGRWAAWFSVFGFLALCVLMITAAFLTGEWHLGVEQ